jgi:hypothetical protein
MSVKVWIPVLCLAACTIDPDFDEFEQASTTQQGTSAQGTSAQGTSAQGTSAQGTSAQGTSSGGAAVSNASVVGTDLQYWLPAGSTWWWQFSARSRCLWNSTRTTKLSCSNVDLATQSSPLVGSRWPTTFVRQNPNGTTTNLHLKLEVTRVYNDTSTAMFDLRGAGAPGAIVACDNPGGCRRNTDLFLYDVSVIDFDGTAKPLCPSGQSAMALAGYWDKTATHHNDANKLSFVCTNGTIAKCVRWGYRPWASAYKNGVKVGFPTPLAQYHQGCVRAAMADYCGDGTSFTQDGTVVDISDYTTQAFPGFIRQRRGVLTPLAEDHSMVGEGAFSTIGADWLDHFRYAERSDEIEARCGDAFVRPQEIVEYQRRDQAVGPLILIESTPACAHSTVMTGRWLHPACSACAGSVGDAMPSCTDPTGPGWTADCVATARARCNRADYPAHDECTTGGGLGIYTSGCTLKMSLKGYASCFDTDNRAAWTSTCVAAANANCTGGLEHSTPLKKYGFCNQPLSTVVSHL